MFCSNCGNEVQEGQAICLNCGFALKPQKTGDNWFSIKNENGALRGISLVLCWFFGAFGGHRLYMGAKGGWLMLIAGLIGLVIIIPLIITAIVAIIDFVMLLIADEDKYATMWLPDVK